MGGCYGWMLWVVAYWCLQSDIVSDSRLQVERLADLLTNYLVRPVAVDAPAPVHVQVSLSWA